MVDTRKKPDREIELELVKALYQKHYSSTDIAVCLQRGRKIYKWEQTDISECLKDVQDVVLEICRRRMN